MAIKLTGELITRGIHFSKTIQIPTEQYAEMEDNVLEVEIKPIKRNIMKNIMGKYEKDGEEISGTRAIEMMDEVCKLGIVDQTVVANLDELGEFLTAKIGTAVIELSTGKGIDLENFSKPTKV